jgi:hypothetical protein
MLAVVAMPLPLAVTSLGSCAAVPWQLAEGSAVQLHPMLLWGGSREPAVSDGCCCCCCCCCYCGWTVAATSIAVPSSALSHAGGRQGHARPASLLHSAASSASGDAAGLYLQRSISRRGAGAGLHPCCVASEMDAMAACAMHPLTPWTCHPLWRAVCWCREAKHCSAHRDERSVCSRGCQLGR